MTKVRIVKRGEKEHRLPDEAKVDQRRPSDIARTVKSWIMESRERRDGMDFPLWLREAREEIKSAKRISAGIVLSRSLIEPVSESAG